MKITFINVGYGESILIEQESPEFPEGIFVMLIDGGSAEDSEYTGTSGRMRAAEYLRRRGILHIDLLVFSHVHEDHTCGLLPILDEIPVEKYWTSIALAPENYGKQMALDLPLTEADRKAAVSFNTYAQLMQKLPQEKITWLDEIHPDYFEAAGIHIDVLGPERAYKESVQTELNRFFAAKTAEELQTALSTTTAMINNASLILRLCYAGRSVLLVGDTNGGGYGHLLKDHPELLRADVFKIGHHGQADALTEELLRAVAPSALMCCASNDERYGSSNLRMVELTQKALPGKNVVYYFQDGLYRAGLTPWDGPRNAVTLTIASDGTMRWEFQQEAVVR